MNARNDYGMELMVHQIMPSQFANTPISFLSYNFLLLLLAAWAFGAWFDDAAIGIEIEVWLGIPIGEALLMMCGRGILSQEANPF